MKQLLHILSYPITVFFYFCFGLILLVFHPLQWISFNLIGYNGHKKMVDYFNWFIIRSLHILGTTFKVTSTNDIPKGVPLIIISNHQSLWDISPLSWFLRKHHPKFVSKKELGKGIPSVSYNLNHGGSVLIDRKNPRQALTEMVKFAKYLVQHNRSGVIFPEGTRSKTGKLRPFHRTGLLTLFKKAPDAYVLPVTINNSWKLQRYGMFPMPLGVRLKLHFHPIVKVSDHNPESLIDLVEKTIKSKVDS